jgi:tetratricopeptide (TPR) repeat protein
MARIGLRTISLAGLLTLGLVLLAAAEPAEAKRKSKNEKPAISQRQNAQKQFEEGLLFYNEGQLKRALERFKEAVQLEPGSPESHYMLGVTYFHLTNLEKAEGSLKEALEVNPFFTDAHNVLGAVYDQQGKVDKAIAEWNIVLSDQNFPQPWNPTFNIGRALGSRESWEEAVVYFKRTVDLNPRWFRAWYHLGLAHEEMGNLQEGKESYEKALDLIEDDNPFLYLVQFRTGLTCYKLGYNVAAEEYFRKVDKSRPDTPEGRKAAEFLDMLENKPAAERGGMPASLYR